MVRTTGVLISALAVATSVSGFKSDGKKSRTRVPGAFIFELDESENTADFFSTVNVEGETRLTLDFELFKGVSVTLHDITNAEDRAMAIADTPAVKNVWPVEVYGIPEPIVEWVGTEGLKPESTVSKRANDTADTYSTHVMTQVDKMRAKGITGKGVHVAVIDTGIDYKHPALGGGIGEGFLVTHGTDFVGDDYDGFNTPVPDQDPMDCAGHGTHVTGIIAAQENPWPFTGTAPDVTLGAYKVFGCHGQVANDVLIAAYNQAYEDGADVITASIGGASGWTEDAWAVAVSRIVEKGVPCPVSAGNDGAEGIFYASTAANGKGIYAVASTDNTISPTLVYLSSYSVDGGEEQTFGYTPGTPSEWDGVSLPLWAPSLDPADPAGGCEAYPDDTPDLTDYIVLIRRGTCTFVQKAQNAAAKGARYIAIYNNVGGTGSFDVSEVAGILAGFMVTAETGEKWIGLLTDGAEVVLDVVGTDNADIDVSYPPNNVTGAALSTYTSWGPTFGVDVKPQFSAPGGRIFSTYPQALGSYAVLSGTSMACPLVAGAIALIAEARGTLDPSEIESLLSAYAKAQLFNDGSGFSDFLAPVPQQGAGMIQVYDAAYATTLLSPTSLSFNDTANFAPSLNFTLSNTGSEEVSFDLSHVPTSSFYTLDPDSIYVGVFPNDAAAASASLALSDSKVSVPAGESVTIEVVATPPEGLDANRLPLWSGYVAINGSDGTALSLPYQGLSGSLYDHTVLGPDDALITSSATGDDIVPIPANTTFVLPPQGGEAGNGTTIPSVAWYLALGTTQLRVDVVALTTCPPEWISDFFGTKTIGQPYGFPFVYQPRGQSGSAWTGLLDNGEYAPEGKYQLVVRALHITGDPEKEEDWDVVETTPFRIRYQD
jgi:subtilisin family serine protease